MNTPLEDPDYVPKHPPVGGKIPEVVAKFGMQTQLRWFKRFFEELNWSEDVSDYYATSEYHKGACCGACVGEFEDDYQGGGVIADGWCCCKDGRIKKG